MVKSADSSTPEISQQQTAQPSLFERANASAWANRHALDALGLLPPKRRLTRARGNAEEDINNAIYAFYKALGEDSIASSNAVSVTPLIVPQLSPELPLEGKNSLVDRVNNFGIKVRIWDKMFSELGPTEINRFGVSDQRVFGRSLCIRGIGYKAVALFGIKDKPDADSTVSFKGLPATAQKESIDGLHDFYEASHIRTSVGAISVAAYLMAKVIAKREGIDLMHDGGGAITRLVQHPYKPSSCDINEAYYPGVHSEGDEIHLDRVVARPMSLVGARLVLAEKVRP